MTSQRNGYVSLGRFTKPHGYKGAINAHLKVEGFNPNKTEKIFLGLGESLVPFFVSKCEIKNNQTFVFYLEGVNSEQEAKSICGKEIYLLPKDLKANNQKAFNPEKLMGYEVSTPDQRVLGVVTEVFSTAAHSLIEIIHQDRKVILPVHPDLVVSIDHDHQKLTLKIADGLLD